MAMNFNGQGVWSDQVTYYSCVPPSVAPAPYRMSSTKTSITVGWKSPSDDGGCSILGYSVHCDDGLGGNFTEVNQFNDPNVRNKPGLFSLEITSPFN
jgi:hypothetical protein